MFASDPGTMILLALFRLMGSRTVSTDTGMERTVQYVYLSKQPPLP
jgi:hypothetical protein